MMRGMWMLLAALAITACGGTQSRDAEPAAVPSAAARTDSTAIASPAESPSAAGDTFAFALHETQPGVVDSITVSRGGRAVQTLVPTENHVLPETEIERISRIDLDFDGHADLGLLTEAGMVNTMTSYWRLDPRTGRFAFAGTAPTLEPDSAAREHKAWHRNGHAGRMWTSWRWRWEGSALVEVRREEQTWLEEVEKYARIVHERRGGAMVPVSHDTLDADEIDDGS